MKCTVTDDDLSAKTSLRPAEGNEVAVGARQFVLEVFPSEMEDIARRRAALVERLQPYGEPPVHLTLPMHFGPTTQNNLAGIALSGGGMRSAAFNLGVLQALDRHGALVQADYLSTVSGGGWIGSCLSSLWRVPSSDFPFDGLRASMTPVLNHLRDRSSALVPTGIIGGAGLFAQFVRGIGATVVLLLPLAVGLALLLRYALAVYLVGTLRNPQQSFLVTSVLGVASLAWFVLSIPIISLVRPQGRARALIDRSYRWSVLGVLLTAAIEAQPAVVERWERVICNDHAQLQSTVFQGLGVLAALGVLAIFVERARPALRLLVLLATMTLSLMLPYLVFVHLTAQYVLVSPAGMTCKMQFVHEYHIVDYLVILGLYFLTDVNVLSMHPYFRQRLVGTFILKQTDGRVHRDEDLKLSELNLPGSIAPTQIINATLNLHASSDRSLRGRNGSSFVFTRRFVGSSRTGYCKTEIMEKLVPSLDVGTAMAVSASAVSPNMGALTIRSLVFLLTFLNLRLGYWLPHPRKLTEWARKHRVEASEDLTVPQRVAARLTWMPRLGCYFRELVSRLHERGRWVYLSDGGHLENTAAYELLRRRCRFIIVSDAEEDQLMQFGGFATLMRFARLDLGVEIDIDLSDVRPSGPRRASRQHVAHGYIRYPKTQHDEAEIGQILYIKSSITGDEDEIVTQYRATHERFPHQSTADQTFTEDQFEAYRALGFHIVDGLFPPRLQRVSGTWQDWFDEIGHRVRPDAMNLAEFKDLRDELEEVESLLRHPDCRGYFAELYPEYGDSPEPTRPAVLHEVVMRQMHLMQSVQKRVRFNPTEAQLHPGSNGWYPLFRRWARAQGFRSVWLANAHTIGTSFEQFSYEVLDLEVERRWVFAPELSVCTARDGDTLRGTVAFRCEQVLRFGDISPVRLAQATFSAVIEGDTLAMEGCIRRESPGFDGLWTDSARDAALTQAVRAKGLPHDGDPGDPKAAADWVRAHWTRDDVPPAE